MSQKHTCQTWCAKIGNIPCRKSIYYKIGRNRNESRWCSWLSRSPNTRKVLGSNPGLDILFLPQQLRSKRRCATADAPTPHLSDSYTRPGRRIAGSISIPEALESEARRWRGRSMQLRVWKAEFAIETFTVWHA